MIITAAIALNLVKSLVLKNTPSPVSSPSSVITTTETTTTTTETKIKKDKGPKPAVPEQGSAPEAKIPYVTLSDCHACPAPCPEESHPHYPSYLKMDHETPLLDSMRPYTRHVLISTGKDDWETHIDDDKDSLAPYLQTAINEGQARLKDENGGRDLPRIVMTNSSKHSDSWEGEGWQVVILPDQIVVNNVTKDQCHDFFEAFLRPPVGSLAAAANAAVEAEKETESKALEVSKEEVHSAKANGHIQDQKSESDQTVTVNATKNGSKTTVVTTTTTTSTTTTRSVSSNGSTTSSPSSGGAHHYHHHDASTDQVRTVKAGNSTFLAHRWVPRAVIMICSHRKRDKRCGVTAAILQKEFKRILRGKDIYGDCEGDVEIWLISHIGGHKFAGNVIVHKQEGMAVWYGRVDPCHCEAIVESTIERGEVLKELYRGSMVDSFDLSRKKIAW